MSVIFGSGVTVIQSFWISFQAMVDSKGLIIQYGDDGLITTVYAFDGPALVYSAIMYDGYVPNLVIQNGYSQAQNDSDLLDFTTNFKPIANNSVNSVTTNQGSGTLIGLAWPIRVTDGTNQAAVKAASTPAVSTDPALVVAISPNNPIIASNPSVGTTATSVPSSATFIGGEVQTLQSSLTTGDLYPLSLTTTGLLRIDGSNVTQPVSGTITVNAGTGNFSIIGTGIAGTPATGIITIQGIVGGTNVSVSQGTNPWMIAGTNADGTIFTGAPVILGGVDANNLVQNISAINFNGLTALNIIDLPALNKLDMIIVLLMDIRDSLLGGSGGKGSSH